MVAVTMTTANLVRIAIWGRRNARNRRALVTSMVTATAMLATAVFVMILLLDIFVSVLRIRLEFAVMRALLSLGVCVPSTPAAATAESVVVAKIVTVTVVTVMRLKQEYASILRAALTAIATKVSIVVFVGTTKTKLLTVTPVTMRPENAMIRALTLTATVSKSAKMAKCVIVVSIFIMEPVLVKPKEYASILGLSDRFSINNRFSVMQITNERSKVCNVFQFSGRVPCELSIPFEV